MAPTLVTLIWYYLTGRLQELQLKPGDRVERACERLYIVRRGTGHVLRNGPGGHDILLRVVRPGAIVNGGDALVAETNLDLLTVPRGITNKCGPVAE
jgi:CRP-like cAMP-binding protein